MVDREMYHFSSLANETVPLPCVEKRKNENVDRKGRGSEVEEEDPTCHTQCTKCLDDCVGVPP